MKYLIVVDMQNDFTIGSLGSVHASAIIPNVLAKVKAFPGKHPQILRSTYLEF